MSIIQDALKKAQITIGAGAPKAAPGQTKAFEDGQAPRTAPAPAKAKPFPKFIIPVSTALLIAAITLIALSLGPLVATRPGRDAGIPAPTPPVQEVRYRALPKADLDRSAGVEAHEAARQGAELASTAPNLVLNGIMYLEEGPRAIVNNAMVEVGEYVSGAKVVRIDRKSVVLVYNDVEITLNLK